MRTRSDLPSGFTLLLEIETRTSILRTSQPTDGMHHRNVLQRWHGNHSGTGAVAQH